MNKIYNKNIYGVLYRILKLQIGEAFCLHSFNKNNQKEKLYITRTIICNRKALTLSSRKASAMYTPEKITLLLLEENVWQNEVIKKLFYPFCHNGLFSVSETVKISEVEKELVDYTEEGIKTEIEEVLTYKYNENEEENIIMKVFKEIDAINAENNKIVKNTKKKVNMDRNSIPYYTRSK